MNHSDQENSNREETPVDDVRRVREQLHRQAGGNITELARLAREAAQHYYAELGLRIVHPQSIPKHRDGTGA